MNCEKCGKEIDQKTGFCASCGTSPDSKAKGLDLSNTAGSLSLIAATFSITACFVGLASYQSYVIYYSTYGIDTSGAIGFLLFASFAVAASIIGFLGAIFSLMRKRFKLAVLGTILMCASAIFTFIITWWYNFGFTDGILVSEVPTLSLALASTILLVKSKKSFVDYTAKVEASEIPEAHEAVDESIFEDQAS